MQKNKNHFHLKKKKKKNCLRRGLLWKTSRVAVAHNIKTVAVRWDLESCPENFSLIVCVSDSVLSKCTKHPNESLPQHMEWMSWPCCGQINKRTDALQVYSMTQGCIIQMSQFEQWLIMGFALYSPVLLSIDFLLLSSLLSSWLMLSTCHKLSKLPLTI